MTTLVMTITKEPTRRTAKRWLDADEFRWAVRDWAVKIGVKTPSICFRPMTTKWASISTRGRMTVDTALLRVSRDLGEFVIVHELVHILAPNHGKLFKSFLLAYLPDWESRATKLRKA
jgi:predicted metal-dependent hydrolase